MAKSAKNIATKKSNTNPKSESTAKSSTSDSSALMDFFIDELKDIYWAEKLLIKTLPKMNKAATSAELKNAFTNHLDVTKTHVTRLEEIFSLLNEKAVGKKCEAMDGITKEGESIIEDTEAGTALRDVGLILAAQKVEHYEIATYGGLAQLAKTLGKDKVANLLIKTLKEEKDADDLLTGIAQDDINYAALEEEA